MPADRLTPPPAPRRLILIADDFGLSAGVDAAIVDLARADRLTGCSAMTRQPHWPEGAAQLRELPQLQVGLHLDLAELDLPLPQALLRAWGRRLGPGVDEAIERQLEAFDRRLGRMPDYLDGHRHIHQWPGVRERVLAAWQRHYGRPPVWARATRPRPGLPMGAKAQVIHRLGGPAWEGLLERAGVRHNRGFLGVYDFQGDAQRYAALLERWCAAAQDGDLMMCHPAADGPAPLQAQAAPDAIAAARLNEYRVWSAPDTPARLAGWGVRLLTGRALTEQIDAIGWAGPPAP
jgi:predicted glycoside hydrolase/deacetylase ChbG (UPF0249 family)